MIKDEYNIYRPSHPHPAHVRPRTDAATAGLPSRSQASARRPRGIVRTVSGAAIDSRRPRRRFQHATLFIFRRDADSLLPRRVVKQHLLDAR